MSWQPIETAPRDGTAIDLWCAEWGGGRITGAKWGCESDDADGEPEQGAEECWVQLDWHTTYDGWYWMAIEGNVTHWMPLPAAPE